MPVIDLTADNFDTVVQNNPFVIVDFWADWCGPCKNFAPVFEEAAGLFSDVVFARVNTEQESALASHFNIRTIPTLLVFREQIIIGRFSRALSRDELLLLVEKAGLLDINQIQQEIQRDQDAG